MVGSYAATARSTDSALWYTPDPFTQSGTYEATLFVDGGVPTVLRIADQCVSSPGSSSGIIPPCSLLSATSPTLLIGSVSVTVTAHAHCPVVVMRAPTADQAPPQSGPVVVGVDGSPLSDAAVAFAFETAAARRIPLVAVHTWIDLDVAGTGSP